MRRESLPGTRARLFQAPPEQGGHGHGQEPGNAPSSLCRHRGPNVQGSASPQNRALVPFTEDESRRLRAHLRARDRRPPSFIFPWNSPKWLPPGGGLTADADPQKRLGCCAPPPRLWPRCVRGAALHAISSQVISVWNPPPRLPAGPPVACCPPPRRARTPPVCTLCCNEATSVNCRAGGCCTGLTTAPRGPFAPDYSFYGYDSFPSPVLSCCPTCSRPLAAPRGLGEQCGPHCLSEAHAHHRSLPNPETRRLRRALLMLLSSEDVPSPAPRCHLLNRFVRNKRGPIGLQTFHGHVMALQAGRSADLVPPPGRFANLQKRRPWDSCLRRRFVLSISSWVSLKREVIMNIVQISNFSLQSSHFLPQPTSVAQ